MAATLAPPRAPQVRRAPQPLIWRLQSLLSSYLPLLLMAFLAAFTWWLVKNTPAPDEPGQPLAPRHVPDYRMSGFELQRFDAAGRLSARILGREMRHYPDTDTIEIDGVELRGHGRDGSLTLASATRALSNGDGSELQLIGDVRVRRWDQDGAAQQASPKLELQGEFMHAFMATEKLRSHLPVTLKTARGEVRASSFEYDNLSGQLQFSGHSTARFDPPAASRKARP
ncbi:LPS export ABC transporter periplasmic protein LptC [Paucibacter sp. APW11]|uniref:LPS export ABC transporter periplasmic protein LptC n=1 Tax=Roseateles aquae TaxID=3077235 RepID=A0ABU3PHC4_9BURK|nr:LPS export ABC transporter periplasmic protein LptC [Paucibacter sp. APW11]MDT9001973.1 LPS export ABC transporter periplasmic protein LptC [Paucibacter sp. APW11]